MSTASGRRTHLPAQNRVAPSGEVVAASGRGAWMGNRGRLHDGSGSREVVRHHQSWAWITCVLSFRGHRAAQWDPHHYTPLFLLDEAVAFAAGHRPCAECRRSDHLAFRQAVATSLGTARLSAGQLDRALHAERWDPSRRARRLHQASWADLPVGAFVQLSAGPALVLADRLAPWHPDNRYAAPVARPRSGRAAVLTPPSTLAVLRSGYPVQTASSGSAPGAPVPA